MPALDQPRPLPLDYDRNPDRFRTGRAVVEEFGLAGDVHAPLAARLRREASGPILDMGRGDGLLGRLLSDTERQSAKLMSVSGGPSRASVKSIMPTTAGGLPSTSMLAPVQSARRTHRIAERWPASGRSP
jgi:hypothetical protein